MMSNGISLFKLSHWNICLICIYVPTFSVSENNFRIWKETKSWNIFISDVRSQINPIATIYSRNQNKANWYFCKAVHYKIIMGNTTLIVNGIRLSKCLQMNTMTLPRNKTSSSIRTKNQNKAVPFFLHPWIEIKKL